MHAIGDDAQPVLRDAEHLGEGPIAEFDDPGARDAQADRRQVEQAFALTGGRPSSKNEASESLVR